MECRCCESRSLKRESVKSNSIRTRPRSRRATGYMSFFAQPKLGLTTVLASRPDTRIPVPINSFPSFTNPSSRPPSWLPSHQCPFLYSLCRRPHNRVVVRPPRTDDKGFRSVAQARCVYCGAVGRALRQGPEWWVAPVSPVSLPPRSLLWPSECRMLIACVAMASGLVVDTSSAFTNATLGTRKDDPKARYSLVSHAIDTFDSKLLHLPTFSPSHL